jgi:excisionase family DNA binding protein
MTAEPTGAGIGDIWDPRPLLTIEVVADLLGTSPERVLQLIESGQLGAFRRGRRVRMSDADVQQFLEQNPRWTREIPKKTL